MTTLAAPDLPMLLEEVEVVRVDRLSPSFVRIELGSPALAEFGVEGHLYDQRIKLVFPDGEAPLPPLGEIDEAFMATWFERPAEERGHMRTYTVRDVVGSGADTRLVVDFVLHGADGHGEAGPGSRWADRAALGDRIVTLAPRRGADFGGIEFVPGTAGRLLLVGDETAVPAVAAILAVLPPNARGAAFLEVPVAADVQTLQHPQGVEVTWLPRDGSPRGERLHAAVLEHLGAPLRPVEVGDDEIDPDLWETPSYSSSGEDVGEHVVHVGHDLDDLYAWIAGESKVVTALRRALVKDLEVDRRQVAFMGYWREGVAMRS
ncbi:siderophore-interacting protein [Nocardioides lianchengensis]|uniref:NADPH-dependent ferric siderophore reductase, contains FAD-binding and SIP domains n=1 Tax=Nocardioides lianchengensis TaxID=1045774 RepID=A0A1G7AD62_9ACTN|nr:siderophore-interacting protein [Nocardioides lianchengensis]NYG13622.1 NADPH-dependent ferric siderophore reductase [Nocardioides lianchengensis]SDE12844.1 NADPH-dependent ferric siderophore reductase, contains FAD-binding and SIP domains [Nocardioides lianchengensis]